MNISLLFPGFVLLAALAGLVLWLHAQRKREVIVPSLRLWQALAITAGATKRNRQWPPLSLPLVLQVLAVILAAIALTQPFIGPRPAEHRIIILDHIATDDPAAGINHLRDTLQSARYVAVVVGGGTPRILHANQRGSDLTASEIWATAAATLATGGAQSDWAAIDRRLEMIDPAQQAEVTVLGNSAPPDGFGQDRPLAQVTLANSAPAQMAFTVTPTATPFSFNITGTIAMAEGLESVHLVIGYADGPGVAPLPWVEKTLGRSISGQIRMNETVTLPGAGELTVTLDGRLQGNLRTDAPQQDQNYLYFGAGQQPLLNAVRALPDAALFQSGAVPADLSGYRMAIVDNTTVDRAPALPTLWIGSAHVAGQPAPTLLPQSDPDAWQTDSPLLAAVDLLPLLPGPAYTLPAIAGADILASAAGQPLIQLAEVDGQRQAWLAFDPRTSNWAEDPALALLTQSLVNWLVPAAPTAACTADDPCYPDGRVIGAITAPSDSTPATVGLPLMPWLLLAAALCILADAVLTARRRGGRIGLPAPLAVIAGALMLAAAFDLPAPQPTARSAVVGIDVAGAAPHQGLRLNTQTISTQGPLPVVSQTATGAPAGNIANAALALELADAMIPPAQSGAILLGAPVVPHPLDATGMAATHAVNSVPLLNAGGQPVLRSMAMNGRPLQGEPLPLTFLIHAPNATQTTLRLQLDGADLSQTDIALAAGDNRVETLLPALADDEGLLQAQIGDGQSTQTAGLIIRPAATRPVAIIAANPDEGAAFARLLADQGMTDTRVLRPDETPDYLRDWADYGGIVLLNTPALDLMPHRQRMIRQMVTEYGLGLLILGGERAFGPGGYFETPLEEISPLSSRVPREAPEVTMVFVLDRSGSMQQAVDDSNRLGVSKRATLSALDLLNPQSQIGIVVFDTEATTIVPLSTVDIDAARTALERVDTGGGTAIYPGLVAAYQALRASQSPAKHIVVMTDGLSQPGDWAGILGQITADGTTVSAVAVGQGADTEAANTIARLGNGVAHVSRDFAALPSILAQEAMMFADPLNTGESQPQWTGATAPFLRAMPATLPPVGGFVLTTAKPDATVAMTAPDTQGEDMPLLAWWRAGNGQVMAFASDAVGSWTQQWHDMPGYGALWADSLRAFQPALPISGLILRLRPQNEDLVVALTALSPAGEGITGIAPIAHLKTPDGTVDVPLQMVGPGNYRGTLPRGATGRYDATLDATSVGAPEQAMPSASWFNAWNPALDTTRSPAPTLALVQGTGGQFTDLKTLSDSLAGTAWRLASAAPPWALLAIALFMLDLVRRYAEIRIFMRRAGNRRPTQAGAR
ncbi:von Willebrand factor type A [Ketogulonicigenium robustum]|uniref:von Willebrand factor type A n=1 Tax=Ketogulonicigenium robustum TaxID=92947 RepID=A0A1W6P261_9RHOB|nr:VWA domain-containing protein [Ketogulonicigenium robustum]ARO15595.1 von Willebrand factor type A [Ketogulonicigenium robustum]